MSTRNTGAAVSCTMLSPAELTVPVDEDLVALMAVSCPHGRAEHVSPSPDVQYPVGDRARYGQPVKADAAGSTLCDCGEPSGVLPVMPIWGRLGRC